MTALPWDLQLLNTLAALLLLLSFAMLSQRRIVALVDLLALQGALLCIATLLLAWRTGSRHLFVSAALTLGLKVIFLPWLLHRLIRRLGVYWDTEPLLNIAGTMLVGVLVVIFAFGLAQPISALASTDRSSRVCPPRLSRRSKAARAMHSETASIDRRSRARCHPGLYWRCPSTPTRVARSRRTTSSSSARFSSSSVRMIPTRLCMVSCRSFWMA